MEPSMAKMVTGTAYFQKVCVQAPSVPWYWGVLHFSDGSYLDWFLPHLATTILSRDPKAWKRRDVTHVAVSQGGLFHDAQNGRSERFKRVTVEKVETSKQSAAFLFISRMDERPFVSLFVPLLEPTGTSTNPLAEAFGLILPTTNIRLRLNRSQLRMSTGAA